MALISSAGADRDTSWVFDDLNKSRRRPPYIYGLRSIEVVDA